MKKPLISISLVLLFSLFLSISFSKRQDTSLAVAETQNTSDNVAKTEIVIPKIQEPVIATPPPAAPKPVVKNTPKPTPKPAPIKKPVVIPPAVPPPVPTPSPAPAPASDCTTGGFNTQFLCLLNQYRVSKGLNQLIYDNSLNAVAALHSTWMNQNSIMSHIGENGSTFDQRCSTGHTVCDAENIAKGYTTAQKLFDAWKASPGHNTNMLGTHTKTGLSLVGIYATSIFK